MDRPRCKTCPHWVRISSTGQCRRFPPERNAPLGWIDSHPVTEDVDSCGEHPDFPAYIASVNLNPPSSITNIEWNKLPVSIAAGYTRCSICSGAGEALLHGTVKTEVVPCPACLGSPYRPTGLKEKP